MARRGENIRRRKDGRWEGRYHAQEPRTGKSTSHSIYGKTYGEVREKLTIAKQTAETLAKEKTMGQGIHFSTVAEEWLSIIVMEMLCVVNKIQEFSPKRMDGVVLGTTLLFGKDKPYGKICGAFVNFDFKKETSKQRYEKLAAELWRISWISRRKDM